MGNMRFLATKIWLKYGILGTFVTETLDKYGTFIGVEKVFKYLKCLYDCIWLSVC